MLIHRLLTGPDDAGFCHRVTEALSRGWALHGAPALTFNVERKTVIAAQAIVKEATLEYSPDLDLAGL
jgi:hypothetical protein